MPHAVNLNRPVAPAQGMTAQQVVNNQENGKVERVCFLVLKIFAAFAAVASIVSLPIAIVWLHNPPLLVASLAVGIFALWALSATKQPAPPQTINIYAAKA